MKIIVCKDYKELSKAAAAEIIDLLKENTNATLGLATGSTPIGLYEELIKSYEEGIISFKDVQTFNLDEYCGLNKTDSQSYYSYMREKLFSRIDVKEGNTHIPSGNGDLLENVLEYQKLLENNPIDIQVLGIGSNGHLGFNEPGTPFSQETFIVDLTEQTRKDNQRFFPSLCEVPTQAITMGLKEIFSAKKIILLVFGRSKIDAVERFLTGVVSEDFPASILHQHPNVTLIIDREVYPND